MDKLKIEYVPIDSIKPYKNNAKLHPDEQVEQICNSIRETGFNDPIGVWHDEIVEGHGRLLAAEKLGMKEVPIIRLDDLTDEQRRAYMLAHNKLTMNSGFDIELLDMELAEIETIDMTLLGFDDTPQEDTEQESTLGGGRPTLAERFLIPPFSVLNTRNGEWQDRKKQWIFGFGIDSYKGREGMKSISCAAEVVVPGYYRKKEEKENELGRNISREEFMEMYKKELHGNSTLKVSDNGGILSIFDPVLAEVCYYWFCPKDGSILDPFAGGSVRGIVASETGHQYCGVDLRQEQVDANIEQAKKLLKEGRKQPVYICGNSLNIDKLVDGKYDMVFSCPPYFDLEQYSDDKEDLSNLDYDEFKRQYSEIIKKAVSKLKDNRFACFVVSEVRNRKTGFYRNFVADTIQAFIDAGMEYYNEIILLNAIGTGAIRAPRLFQNTRKVVRCHQNVLVFYKGNPKTIKQDFGEIKIQEITEEMLEE